MFGYIYTDGMLTARKNDAVRTLHLRWRAADLSQEGSGPEQYIYRCYARLIHHLFSNVPLTSCKLAIGYFP